MKIFIGSDHAGVELKAAIIKHLAKADMLAEDLGPFSTNSVDYPDYAHTVCLEVLAGPKDSFGILICGSGNGINMSANKHQEIRSALCWEPEIASLSRQHNDANVIALPARFISEKKALKIIDAFLDAEFEGGRHENRVNKIAIDFDEE